MRLHLRAHADLREGEHDEIGQGALHQPPERQAQFTRAEQNRLEAGLVQNNQNLVVQANLSYGGVKSSGLGKEASLEAMLEHFTHKKTIMVNMA